MYTYFAYGLSIHSALPLPEFQTQSGVAADVVIQYASSAPSPAFGDGQHRFTSEEAYLVWEPIAAFRVRQGREVTIEPFPNVEESQIRLLLNPVLAVVLHQRQHLVLHASAIALQGNVVAFVGEKGAGKSTMAATLYKRGHELVADDIVALSKDDSLQVTPGFPQFKLWSDAVVALAEDPQTLSRLDAQYDKHARPVTERFCQTALPLKRIYVLAEGEKPAIKPLPPQLALRHLFTHWYLVSVANQLLQGEGAAVHLQQCARLVSQIPVCLLERPRDHALLPQVAEQIEADLFGHLPHPTASDLPVAHLHPLG